MMISRVLASCGRLTTIKSISGATQLQKSSPAASLLVPSRQLTVTGSCFANKFGGNQKDDGCSTKGRGRSNSKSRGSKGKSKDRSRSKSKSGIRSSKTGGDSRKGGNRSPGQSSKSGSVPSSSSIKSGINWAKSKMDEMTSRFHSSNVRQEKANNRFVLDLDDGQLAFIDYKSIGRNKIDMYHTEVPAELRGRGIGRELAKGALEQAAATNTKVRLSCSYLVDYLNKCADDKIKSTVEM